MDPVYVGLCVYIVDIKLPMGESLLLAGLKEKVHTGERVCRLCSSVKIPLAGISLHWSIEETVSVPLLSSPGKHLFLSIQSC